LKTSEDGKSYHTIGKIDGAGNSSIATNYKFYDKKPSVGKNYYRVIQVDFDGDLQYSNVAAAQFKTNDIVVYPNPVYEELIVYSSEEQDVVIYNQVGQKVKQSVLKGSTTKIDISGLSKGVYYLKFREEVKIIVKN